MVQDFDLTAPPPGFVDNPYPLYAQLRHEAPLLQQPDGSLIVSRYADLQRIYRDTTTFSSDKKAVFKPRFGDSPLYQHHTTSLVFNDPPLHTRVRKIMVGALTPSAIAKLEHGLIRLIDSLLEALPEQAADGEVDLIEHFAARIPINVIGNLFDIPSSERGPLRDWSLAILGALEPTVNDRQRRLGDDAVVAFKSYLADLAAERRQRPGDPSTDVLTRLMQIGVTVGGDSGRESLSEVELLHNCIFILNAGHETTTNLISNALASLDQHPGQRRALLGTPSLINTAVDEFLRYESPNQLGNRLTTTAVDIGGVTVDAAVNLHLVIGAANRDEAVFEHPDTLRLDRKPNKHLAFAGGPHACVGLNLARLEGRIAIGRFVQRFPNYRIARQTRSSRLRFRGFTELTATL